MNIYVPAGAGASLFATQLLDIEGIHSASNGQIQHYDFLI